MPSSVAVPGYIKQFSGTNVDFFCDLFSWSGCLSSRDTRIAVTTPVLITVGKEPFSRTSPSPTASVPSQPPEMAEW